MGLAEYKAKCSIEAFQFTDPMKDMELLYEFGIKDVEVFMRYRGGDKIIKLNGYVNHKCIFCIRLGDYIIKDSTSGCVQFIECPKEKFEQMYDYVKDIEIEPPVDEDCADINTDLKNPAYVVLKK